MEISGRARALPDGSPATPLCQSGRDDTVLNPPAPPERIKVGWISRKFTGSVEAWVQRPLAPEPEVKLVPFCWLKFCSTSALPQLSFHAVSGI